MAAAPKNLEIEKGTKFVYPFLVKNGADSSVFDLTGYTAVAKIRETPESRAVIATFTGATDIGLGKITLTLSSTVTSALTAGIYHWDCFIQSSSDSRRFLAGRATVTERVSS